MLGARLPPLFLCSDNAMSHEDGPDGEAESSDVSPKKMRPTVDDNQRDRGPKSSNMHYRQQLAKELEKYKQQNQLLRKRRHNIFKSMVAFHELYETGLDSISRLNDLRFVPDNVMPDETPR